MKLSLRTKIMSMIVLVGGLLLFLALAVIWTLGYQQRVAEQGAGFQSEAAHVARSIGRVVEADISQLNDLIVVGDLAALAALDDRAALPVAEIEARWRDLAGDDPLVLGILENPLAAKLRVFNTVNPLVVEMLVADTAGRLIAATGKTSDYDQSDETWWQGAMRLRGGEAVLEGLALDESAGVFSLDLALPLIGSEGRPVGVLKAVLNVSPLFAGVSVFSSPSGAVGEVVASDGRVLLRLSDEDFLPSGKSLPASVMATVKSGSPGWFFADLNGSGRSLAGFAPVGFLGVRGLDGYLTGDSCYVIVHESASAVLAPLRQRAWVLMIAGAAIILVCGVVTMVLVGRNFLTPLEILENAASALAATAGQVLHPPRPGQTPDPAAAIAAVAGIKTGDEIEEFARDFGTMSGRLMRYQEDLRREIAEKTEAIQSDLDMAREFQQAFLPRAYPEVPSATQSDPLTLHFQHVYQAAMSVSGDFFDIIKLNDSRAGVLIADVMGHGTRSALVTAILRTLLHGLARAAHDPAIFLSLLNRNFHDTMRQADQLIFVSACFVVLDTRDKTLRFASAGHPSPFIGNRATGRVAPIHGPLKENPALGLFPESEYQEFSRPLSEDDLLLLYTDGIIEAQNDEGFEYGRERLAAIMRKHLDMEIAGFTQAVLENVLQFTGYQPPADDLCIVTVEVAANNNEAPPVIRRKSLHESLVEL